MLVWFWFCSHASDTVGSKDIGNLWHEARYAWVTPRGRPCKSWHHALFFYSTIPKSCSHWSSLLLGATLGHAKILWTLCPTKLMAFCKIGPSNRSSNPRTPLGGAGLCAIQTGMPYRLGHHGGGLPRPTAHSQDASDNQGVLPSLVGNPKQKNLHLPLLHFLLPLTFPSRSIFKKITCSNPKNMEVLVQLIFCLFQLYTWFLKVN